MSGSVFDLSDRVMHQACAYGSRPVLLTYDGELVEVSELEVTTELYLVCCILNELKHNNILLAFYTHVDVAYVRRCSVTNGLAGDSGFSCCEEHYEDSARSAGPTTATTEQPQSNHSSNHSSNQTAVTEQQQQLTAAHSGCIPLPSERSPRGSGRAPWSNQRTNQRRGSWSAGAR